MLLFWLMCAFIGTAMLQMRGIGFFVSGFLGLCLGPIAILMACFIPKQPGKSWTKGW